MRPEKQYPIEDLNPDTYIGIGYPINGTVGVFKQNQYTESQMIDNLKNLLLTRKGERPFQPDFGSSLFDLLFENQISTEQLEISIRQDVGRWLPNISLDKIDIFPYEHELKIELLVSVELVTEDAIALSLVISPAGNANFE